MLRNNLLRCDALMYMSLFHGLNSFQQSESNILLWAIFFVETSMVCEY